MSGMAAVPARFRSQVADNGRQVSLANQEFTSVPEWIRELTELTTLDLGSNKISTLPEWLGDLTSLSILDLGDNGLTTLPQWIGKLKDLKVLNLIRNQLTDLPESARNLTSLVTLDLGGNQLRELPDWIGDLSALNWLSLYGNPLTDLPDALGNLGALDTLDLFGAGLEALPESIGNLHRLSQLSLRQNNMTALPESVGNLSGLRLLDLRDNQFATVPRSLADLVARHIDVRLDGNPLRDPLPEIIGRGPDALATYLRSLDHEVALYEAKLLLVGEGNVGKTSLVAALRGAPFVDNRPTTHGIEIWPLTFPHPELDQDMTLSTWDFGGQEVYRVSHQFFFTKRALYLMVWNARQGHEQDEVEAWLRRIRLRTGGDVRVIVVATHCDERLPELDYPHLQQVFQKMLAGSFDVDNFTRSGIAELRDAIARQASRLPQMGQFLSPRWIAARDEILSWKQSDPQILFEDFAQACARHDVIGREVVTLAGLMHDLGQIVYYAEDEGLKDIVVLNPEWLTKAISYVLEDQATRDAAGVLDHARLKEIWQDRSDGPSYPAKYHRYFLRLMEKFDISYRIEDDELHSIVAQLVPHERSELPWRYQSQPPEGTRVLALVCRLSEPAPGLIPWLTVRHHDSSTGRHWRRGVFLRHPIAAYDSEALIELRGPAELVVEVRAPSPDLFFSVLRDSIEYLIRRRWPGLDYQLLIPCPGQSAPGVPCAGLFPLTGVTKLRERGLIKVPCMECAQEYEVSLLLTGFPLMDQPLGTKLSQLHDQLMRIEGGVARTEHYAATTAESVRRVLRAVSAEVTDCPRLFTLIRDQPTGPRRLRFFQQHYRLTLWCEHPGHWHPCTRGYELDPPRDWFAAIGPYAALVVKTLQLAVPLAGSVAANILLPADQFERARDDLQLMEAIVAELSAKPRRNPGGVGADPADGLTAAEGQGLRGLRAQLFDQDRSRAFGGLRRVLAATGDFLWVCPDHYREYDPGLPVVP
jgi:internalin A